MVAEKHVRFDFGSNAIILPPPSPDPSITPEDFDKHASKVDDEFFFQPYVTLCTKKFGQGLSTSRTFPMATNNQDFGEDFCPKSYKQPPEPVNPQKPTVRRMSLKEFTGLENASKPVPRHNSAAYQNGLESPILSRLQSSLQSSALGNQPFSMTRSNEYLDKCGSRRRSSSGIYGSREHVYEPFDKVIDEINATIDGFNLETNEETDKVEDAAENFNSEQMLSQIDFVRKRLSITLEKIPAQSPKRRPSVDAERNKILIEIGRLSNSSKVLIRSVYAPISDSERHENTMHTIRLADNVTKQCENLIEQRTTSYYQAHLLKAELDQLLLALSETIKAANLAVDKQRYGAEFRRLSKSTTSLAASFTQFLRAIKSF
ncbi:hypothetical protein M3Y97_00865200 [Aphelenchoides bicaudatus]|nr:hypothetical protein M3Y97_00865200 [Aphelenchoides bicaudatus]